MNRLNAPPRLVRRRGEDQGFALITSIILIMSFAGLALSYFAASTTSVRHAERRESSVRMEVAANGAAELLAQDLWNRYITWNGGEAGKLDNFRQYLNAGGSQINVAPGQGGAFGAAADAISLICANPNDPRFGSMRVALAEVRRRDTTTTTDIEVTISMATGDNANARSGAIRQVFSVGGEEFKGFEYSLLTNNVNCIMCHATFDNSERYYNTDASALSSFDRVKIGTLESMQIRPDSAESQIFGTLHSRGILMDDHGNLLPSLDGTSLTGVEMDEVGKIYEDEVGDVYEDDLALAEGDPLPEFGDLYLDYPIAKEDMTDGILPESFPSAIPDLDGDNVVDPEEFALVASQATGKITGDMIQVNAGDTFTSAPANMAGQIEGTTDKHVILVGTEDNPIILDGRVAINGDVALMGVVKGEGAIYASGNIYLLGDVTYADGVDANGYRTFGVGEDGTPNAMGLAAGGNIVAGDHLSIPTFGNFQADGPVNGDGTGSFNFTMNEMATFNRREWSRTQQTLPGLNGPVANPHYDADYTPRYYVLNEGDPIFIFNGDDLTSANQSKLYYDPIGDVWKGAEALTNYDDKYLQQIDAADPAYQAASILALSPKGDWLSTETLQALRAYAEAIHDVGPMQIDALLYTNNATFTMVRPQSKYVGKMVLNGGIVSADTGVLVPKGLQLNFDSRPSKHVSLADLTKPVEMRRAVWSRVGNVHP